MIKRYENIASGGGSHWVSHGLRKHPTRKSLLQARRGMLQNEFRLLRLSGSASIPVAGGARFARVILFSALT
jgi:hypothetical protein